MCKPERFSDENLKMLKVELYFLSYLKCKVGSLTSRDYDWLSEWGILAAIKDIMARSFESNSKRGFSSTSQMTQFQDLCRLFTTQWNSSTLLEFHDVLPCRLQQKIVLPVVLPGNIIPFQKCATERSDANLRN